MDVTLRAAVAQDAPRLSVLLEQLGWQVTPEQVVGNLAAPDVGVTVAEADGEVVGVVVYVTRRHFHRAGDVTTIDTLVVDEEQRSRGIGEQLVRAVFDAASHLGVSAVEVISHPRRVDARRFYERLGFAVDGNYFVQTL